MNIKSTDGGCKNETPKIHLGPSMAYTADRLNRTSTDKSSYNISSAVACR